MSVSAALRQKVALPSPKPIGKTATSTPVKPNTIAKSIAIGNPADGVYALEVARKTNGSIESVNDAEIIDGIKLLAETEGIFTETAGGTTIAVLKNWWKQARLTRMKPPWLILQVMV